MALPLQTQLRSWSWSLSVELERLVSSGTLPRDKMDQFSLRGVEGGGGRERERNHQSDCWVGSARHIYLISNDAGGALNVHSNDFAYFQFCFCDNKLETLQCIVGIGIGAGFRGHYINFDNNVLFCTLLV